MAALEGPLSEWEPILLALEGQGLDALASASTTSLMILVSAHGHRPHPPPSSLSFGWLHHHAETALSKATRARCPC